MEEKKKSNAGLIVLVVILLLACAGMGAFIFVNKDKLTAKENTTTTVKNEKKETNEKTEETNEKTEETNEKTENCSDRLNNINQRLYSVDSEMHKQRYQLLMNDMEYGDGQDFLKKKAYILDLNMVDSNNAIIKEVDLASAMKSYVDDYISKKSNGKTGCKVEYMNPGNTLMIDFEKEVAFKGYYHCFENGVETSLGSNLYAYNVETNSIRNMGAIR